MNPPRSGWKIVWALGSVAACFLVFLAPSAVEAVWTEPTAFPPYGNVAAPLNTSDLDQTKVGGLEIQGGLTVTENGLVAPVTLSATAITNTTQLSTVGVKGIGGIVTDTTGLGSSMGVYGITTNTPSVGAHYGVLGVAGANASNFIGVAGWDQGLGSAYAGYFRGSTRVEGDLMVTKNAATGAAGVISGDAFCLVGSCITSWARMFSDSYLFTESPENHTFLKNTSSSLTIGGVSDGSSAFLFDVEPTAERSVLYTPGSIVLGEPATIIKGDGICQASETCAVDNQDCWGQQDSCGQGEICTEGVCTRYDQDPPLGGYMEIIDATPNNMVCLRGSATDYKSGVGDYHFYYKEGPYTVQESDYVDLGYQAKPDFVNIALLSTPLTEYSCVVRARDQMGNEQAFADGPHASATTPPVSCATDADCAGSPRPYCCQNSCEQQCGGGSPIMNKIPIAPVKCQPNDPDYPYCLVKNDAPRTFAAAPGSKMTTPIETKNISFLDRVKTSAQTAYRWVSNQFTKTFDSFEAPNAHAAGSFGGSPTRLTINNGVITIVDAAGSKIMEIGNAGTDIASTDKIYIRPNTTTQGSYFSGTGSTQDLLLTGRLSAGTIMKNGLPALTITTLPLGSLTTCTQTCTNAGQTCWLSESAAATVSFLTCAANGSSFPGGTNCLCY